MGGTADALTAFNGLPMGEKHKVLLATNPDYAGLPPAEQVKALDAIHNGPAPSQGLRNNLADRIDQGRGMVERGVTSAMQGMGLPTNPDEADKFVMGDPNESAIGGMVRSHMEAGAKDPVGYVPMLGPIAVRASEHANTGQYPEMAGDLAAGVATVSPFKDVAGRAGTNLGQRVAKATRTPEGDLGPVTSKAASAAGGVAGMTAGYKMTPKGVPPYYGAAAGGAVGGGMGTALADRMIPKVKPPNPTPFKGDNLNWTPPGEMLGPESPTPAQLSLGRRVGERTAAAEAASGEAVPVSKSPANYRGPESVPKPAPPSPFGNAIPSRGPLPNQPLPSVPQGNPTPFPRLVDRTEAARIAAEEAEARKPVPASQSPGTYRGPTKPQPPESAAIAEGPTGARHAAVRGAQADVARRNARQFVPTGDAPSAPSGIGVPGSPQQEAGYQAPVLKIPEPKGKQPKVTPEQVPGPDTAGKGNLLTPGAKRGVEGFGDEHVRRGRPVLYTQEQYPGRRLEGTLADRLGQSSPTLSQRTGGNGAGGNGGGNGYKPTEKAATMSGERRNLGPEFDAQQREEMIGRYKGILRHPDATPTDIAEATARLKELGATQ